MKNQTSLGLLAVSASLACATAGHAQGIDGLYQPSGASWSCSADQVGMDGGALSIQGDVLNGVENRCDLTSPRPDGTGTRYTAVCSAEGEEYREDLTLTPTANGLSHERDGSTVYWEACGAAQGLSEAQDASTQPTNGKWVYDFRQGFSESSTRDPSGNVISFSCNDIGEDGGLYVELGGQPVAGGQIIFDVDGEVFPMTVWADSGSINTECTVCADTYTALWEAAAAGNVMTVRASDGRSAAFSLRGSRDALGDVACRPDDGF